MKKREIAPRWRKVLVDLWGNKIRTLLVVASIAVGVFALGTVTGTYLIILQDMDAQYQSISPHSAYVYSDPFEDDLVDAVRRMPEVGEAEGRTTFSGRIRGPADEWLLISITTIPPLDEMRIDRLRPVDVMGGGELEDREIFLERSGLGVVPVKPGDSVMVELPDKKIRELRVAGIVHDLSVLPYIFVNQLYGYVTPDTMEWLGLSREYNQMVISVAENPRDEEHVREVARAVEDRILRSGRRVPSIFVFKPGEHPAAFIIRGVMALLGVMGLLTLFLSGFLVVNTISALLSQHVQQIGMMKAVGARTGQIMSMYVMLVLGFGFLALLIAVPLSVPAAFAFASWTGQFLNFDVFDFRVRPEVLVLEIVVALMAPLLAASVPVVNGMRTTIREALSDYGLGQGRFGRGWIDRLLEKIRGLPRPVLLSLRNTFRRKGRLLLTLSTLTLGGAIFIAVFNVRASFTATIDEVLGLFLSDVNVFLNRTHRIEEVETVLMGIPGVTRVEAWTGATGQLLSPDGDTETDIEITAPPKDSTLIQPVLLQGRWLRPEDEGAIVATNILLSLRPEIQVGDDVVTRIQGKEYTWRVVGIAKVGGNYPAAPMYASYDGVAQAMHQFGSASEFRIGTSPQDAATQARVGEMAEAQLERAGIRVGATILGSEIVEQNELSFAPVIVFLLAMAVLIALVGGLGLASTMSMNVLERTRELGVMRAIGASDRDVVQMVVVEGLLIGLISWGLGTALAVPISRVLGTAVGVSLMSTPLAVTFAWDGFVIWLVVVLVLSALASILPARNASRITIRDALVYE